MATKTKAPKVPGAGFDVIVRQTIGRVTFDDHSGRSAYVVAFEMIGAHGEPGEFEFPGEFGPVVVNVTHERTDGEGFPIANDADPHDLY